MALVFQNITPHPPHRLAIVYPSPLVLGEDTLAGRRGGWGVNILEDARHSSVLYICKYFVTVHVVFCRQYLILEEKSLKHNLFVAPILIAIYSVRSSYAKYIVCNQRKIFILMCLSYLVVAFYVVSQLNCWVQYDNPCKGLMLLNSFRYLIRQ
jgi:hypothetical protein